MRILLASMALVPALSLTACESAPDPVTEPSSSPSASSDSSPTEPSAPTSTPTPEASAPAGTTVESTTYVDFAYPSTWTDVTADAQANVSQVGVAFADEEVPGEFRTNVNYLNVPAEADYTNEEFEAQFRKEITSVGAEVLDFGFESIGGENTIVATSVVDAGGFTIYLFQSATLYEGKSHVFTLSTTDQATGEEVFNTLLSSIVWK